jgi:hypothetical protein
VSVCLSVCRSVSQSVAILYSLFRVNMVLNIPGVIEHVAECAQDLLVEVNCDGFILVSKEKEDTMTPYSTFTLSASCHLIT